MKDLSFTEFRIKHAELLAEENELKIRLDILKKQNSNEKMRKEIKALERAEPIKVRFGRMSKKQLARYIIINLPVYVNSGCKMFNQILKGITIVLGPPKKQQKKRRLDGSQIYQEPRSKLDYNKIIWGK